MSAAGAIAATHNVSERLAWELQAPLTVRPQDFQPFPATTDWRVERNTMEQVCLQCHSYTWTSSHFDNLDRVIEQYNTEYYLPIKARMDSLYDQQLLTRRPFFDEELEWEFYEFCTRRTARPHGRRHDGPRLRLVARLL